jgi:hypothetical protein
MFSITTNRTFVSVALALAVVATFAFALPAYALTGAIYTTDIGCNGVNVNLFADKDAVYLDGGPHHIGSSGLPEGYYYVQVTVPNGAVLGTSVGSASPTPAHVDATGTFATCYQLSAIVVKASNSTTAGYDDTTNGGGVYKVWVSDNSAFSGGNTKTDNFKVKVTTPPPPDTGSISGVKWEDANADGVKDVGEVLLSGWAIDLYDSTHTTLMDSTVTDGLGAYLFTGVVPGTYQVCEEMPTDWYPSYPTTSDPNCNTSVVVTANNNTGDENFGNYQDATITVHKNVVAPDGTTDVTDTHSFSVTLDSTTKPFAEGTDATYTVKPGTYSAVEGADTNYTFVSDSGPVTVGSGGSATITITNKQNISHLIVIKHVVRDNGGTAASGEFTMHLTGTSLSANDFAGVDISGVDVTLWSGAYGADETGDPSRYAKTLGTDCSGTIGVGETKTCTITNDDIAPSLTLVKKVINDDFGTAIPENFTLIASGPLPGISASPTSHTGSAPDPMQGSVNSDSTFKAGTYTLSESGPAGYKASNWICTGDYTNNGTSISLGLGQSATCTITNDDMHGRMTGGGSIFTATSSDFPTKTRVTHGFELLCRDPNNANNRLEVNWNDKNGKSQKFHLTSLSKVDCTDNDGHPAPPAADFNTFHGTGTGTFNGKPGATIEFTFTDNGEPGTADTAIYTITKGSEGDALKVNSAQLLTKGNHQAHRY